MIQSLSFKGTLINAMRPIKAILLILSIISIASTVPARSAAPLCTSVFLDGPASSVPIDEEFIVTISIGNVANLYGASFSLSFDPSYLQVLDDDPGKTGIQITPGDCPLPDFVVGNTSDNTGGSIIYMVTQLMPSLPCSGSVDAAHMRLKMLQVGVTFLQFTGTLLTDPDGVPIQHSAVGLTISSYSTSTENKCWGAIKALYR